MYVAIESGHRIKYFGASPLCFDVAHTPDVKNVRAIKMTSVPDALATEIESIPDWLTPITISGFHFFIISQFLNCTKYKDSACFLT
jgi:hypothetical protein